MGLFKHYLNLTTTAFVDYDGPANIHTLIRPRHSGTFASHIRRAVIGDRSKFTPLFAHASTAR